MINITFATTLDRKCGVAAYSGSLVAELRKHVEVEVVDLYHECISPPGNLAAALNRGDIAHIQHQYPFFGGMAFHRNRFRRSLRGLDVPLVVTVHELDMGDSDVLPIRAYKRWFNRYLFSTAEIARLIVHSSEYRDMLEGLGLMPADIRVIPEGAPEVLPTAIPAEDAKLELKLAGKRVVMIFGFVVRRKGYEIALEALRRWRGDVVLLIAGGPHPDDRTGFFDQLKSRIAASDLSDRVMITGYLSDEEVPLVMAAADVAVAPFTTIGNSGSILRCMAYGKPVAASNLPLTREINERLPCLSLFNASDPADLAERVGELLDDERRREAAVAAVRSYAETWTVARSAAETITVYEELLGR